MRVGRFDVVRELDVAQLRATDRSLLLFDGQSVPGHEVMNILLHDDVAAAGELRILVADHDRGEGGGPLGVLGTVDEPEQITLVERPEAVDLVDHAGRTRQPLASAAERARSRDPDGVHGCERAGRPASPRPCASSRRSSRKGWRPAGRGHPKRRSQRPLPRLAMQVSSPSGMRKPTDRFSALTSASSART